jgi:hypothetical protein
MWGGQGPYKDCRATDEWMNAWKKRNIYSVIKILDDLYS